MLIDSVEITLKAGKGGDGVVRWRHEKYVAKGGPDGGDGGRGGSIFFEATDNLDTLANFRYRKIFSAPNGEDGKGKKMTGKSGEDITLLVPTGTVVVDAESSAQIADLKDKGETFLAAKGGKGGLGNIHFASSTNQNPMHATKGVPGEERQVKLELQLIADMALIGEPNAGKSSIISVLTGANSKIGAYAFTTTQPVLGVLRQGDHKITLVDLPGLIEGAHRGRGLGHDFLRHTKRVKALIYVVDATTKDADESIQKVDDELVKFEPTLSNLPRLFVFNKTDLLTSEELDELKNAHPSAVFVSAQNKTNLTELVSRITDLI